MTSENRVVVTGMGCVTPFGVGLDTFWDGLISGRSAVAATADEVWRQWAPVVAACNHFSPADFLPRKQVMNTDRFTQFALVAGAEALRHAGLLGESGDVLSVDGDNVGIALGSAFGGIQTFEAASIRLSTQNTSRVGARVVSKSIPNAAAAALAMQHHIRGPVMTYATACASAANAIGEALSWLYTGQVDVVLAGGAECLFTPTILAGLHDAGALATSGPEDLSQWSRPFDADRRGMVMGEGAAFLVLETRRHAERRGAQVLGELLGYGASCDAYHETAPHPEGAGAVLAMRRALKSARLDVGEIGYVNAHATSTPAGDSAEIRALRELFGEHLDNLPVSSIKGATGHMLGAAGAVEAVATVQALRTGVLPPTLNCDRPEAGAPADLVSNEARPCPVDTAISNSFGFGGQNGVLVFGRSGR
ncbi:MAG: beta-ketoacyl-[acyl-carrier-protein] synthase family protein [Alicyclobacillus sp.]|nr:beta-ketoacyl-[acyl-carrier-protein] synthase family protein [Alicyclobacillus sp.]